MTNSSCRICLVTEMVCPACEGYVRDDGARRAALADALERQLIHDINGDVSGMYRASDQAVEAISNAIRYLRGANEN